MKAVRSILKDQIADKLMIRNTEFYKSDAYLQQPQNDTKLTT